MAVPEEIRGQLGVYPLGLEGNGGFAVQGICAHLRVWEITLTHFFLLDFFLDCPDVAVHGASSQDLVHMSLHRNTPKLSNWQGQINSIQSSMISNTFKESCNKLPHNDRKLENIQTLPDYLNTKCVNCYQTFEYWNGSSRERDNTMQLKNGPNI